MKSGKQKYIDPVKQEEDYVAFLKKRLESEHYRANVSPEEYNKTEAKYKKAKFRLKVLKTQK